jgi:hypothetical protein
MYEPSAAARICTVSPTLRGKYPEGWFWTQVWPLSSEITSTPLARCPIPLTAAEMSLGPAGGALRPGSSGPLRTPNSLTPEPAWEALGAGAAADAVVVALAGAAAAVAAAVAAPAAACVLSLELTARS